MRREITKNSTPRKSKMIWLLFATPLLVPVLWFGCVKYKNRYQVIEIPLVAAKVLPGVYPNLHPYRNLAQALIRYPCANRFVVTWMDNGSQPGGYFPDYTLQYNRFDRTLWEYYRVGSYSGSDTWANVEERAIQILANSESVGQPKGLKQLRKNGAKLTSHYRNMESEHDRNDFLQNY